MSPWRGNPYYLFARRPFREARLRAYIVREHRRGRPVVEIIADPYVRRCGSERFCWAVLQDPRTVEALHRNDVVALSRSSEELEHDRARERAERPLT
jgi:hypothetical protein